MLVTGVLFSVVIYITGSVPEGLTAYAMLMRQSKRVVVKIRFMLLVRQGRRFGAKGAVIKSFKSFKSFKGFKVSGGFAAF